jgi:hypothetical protein
MYIRCLMYIRFTLLWILHLNLQVKYEYKQGERMSSIPFRGPFSYFVEWLQNATRSRLLLPEMNPLLPWGISMIGISLCVVGSRQLKHSTRYLRHIYQGGKPKAICLIFIKLAAEWIWKFKEDGIEWQHICIPTNVQMSSTQYLPNRKKATKRNTSRHLISFNPPCPMAVVAQFLPVSEEYKITRWRNGCPVKHVSFVQMRQFIVPLI